jgi:hypothetical protein
MHTWVVQKAVDDAGADGCAGAELKFPLIVYWLELSVMTMLFE